MKKVLVVLIAAFLITPFTTAAAGSADAGKSKAAVCGTCHGSQGISGNPLWPNLAGQKEGYTAKQMKDYKSGARKNPIMSGQAAGLSDEDIANLAAYYASLSCK